MAELINIVLGVGIIVLNLIPFIIKKVRYLFLTILISLLILFLLAYMRNPLK